MRTLTWADASLGLTWLFGYFAFDALRLTIKSSATRRGRYLPALATYTLVASAFGALTVLLGGWKVLWWTPIYALLLGPALLLIAHGMERSIACGVVTILASCGLMPVLRFGTPLAITDKMNALSVSQITLMIAVTGYFIGTVWHIKALIRERNNPEFAKRSAAALILVLL